MTESEVGAEVAELAEHEAARQKIEASFEEAGLKERLDSAVMDRLVLLEVRSKFNEDARLIEKGVKNILEEIQKRNAEYGLTPERLEESRIAALIHDVGKSGPANATPEQQSAVVRLFALENIKDPKLGVADTARQYLDAEEAEGVLARFAECGIDGDMSMRDFWSSHAKWGFEIIDQQCPQLSRRTKLIAASHHIDRGEEFNFYNVPAEEVPDEARLIGQMEDYTDILQERALIAIDKYEASVRRSDSGHAQAMAWVEQDIKGKYGNDKFMNLVLQVMRDMGKERIFG